ncbi:MAG: MerR family transcriptional regulator [Ardenticatenaceae bacterium]|nr:MerR family transcriptional regulator [Ardenticatenaceae bacterium]
MFKIGEFSQLGQVSTRMLRHYDKLGLLIPSHTDEWTGYRYYTIDQLPRLHRIIALKELGLSLEQISNLLAGGDDLPATELRGMLRMRQADLAQELQAKQMQLLQVETRLRQIEQEGRPSPYEVVVKPIPAQPVASIRQIVPSVAEFSYYCDSIYGRLYRRLDQLNIPALYPEVIVYHATEYQDTDLDVEMGVTVSPESVQSPPAADDLEFQELPAFELAAAIIYEGPYKDLLDGVLALLKYVGTHGHIPAGPLRELHLSGPAHAEQGDDALPVIELQLPIERVSR